MKVVAARLEQKDNNPILGLVRPLLLEESMGARPVALDEFPNNNSIFIIGDYEEIKYNYSDYDLFRISYEENYQFDPNHPGLSQYAARSGNASRVEKTAYFHIIDFPFNFESRVIKNLEFRPERFVVLRNSGDHTLYGPFDYTVKNHPDEGTYSIELKPPHGVENLPEHSVFRFTEDDFEIVELRDRYGDVRDKVLAAVVSDLGRANLDRVDFMADDELVKWGNSLLSEASGSRLSKADLREFKQEINSLERDEPSFAARKERLLRLIDKTQFWNTQRSNLISDFLKSSEGKEQINSYIEANRVPFFEYAKERYKGELEKEYGDIEKRFEDTQAKIEEKESKLVHLDEEIKKSQEQKRAENLAASTEELEELNKEIHSRKNELNLLGSIEDLRVEKRVLESEIKKLEDDKESLAKVKEDLEEEKEGLKQAGEQLRRHNEEKSERLRERLSEFKPFIDMLNGVIPSRGVRADISSLPRVRKDKPATAEELIEEVQGKLRAVGRDMKPHELANYLVSIQQNFFTVFAGLPGVGKTSLVTYLARVLGLKQKPEEQNRFLTIATARGWTSPRDLIGFYNPLSGSFQPSSTGLFELLSAVQKDEAKAFPSWVLLDEANLSPLEHYFSTFLRMCDDYVERNLLTGDKGERARLEVPDSMRFLGTVNYDATTEPLSPRMLDRVPIIRINPPAKGQDLQFDEEAELSEQTALLTEEDMCELFGGAKAERELKTDELNLLREIVEALRETDPKKGLAIVVSPRKQKAIERFCSVARPLMREHYELSALDYAVAQHILPLINGYGDKYRKRLDGLAETITHLSHSEDMLSSILEVGENEHGFYRFFV